MTCAANIGQIVDGYEFVIDGTDNFVAKFLIDDACVPKGNPIPTVVGCALTDNP